jgi:malonyl-CoA decarboxylase
VEAIDEMNENGKAGFLDRTLNNLRNAWQAIAGSAYDESSASLRPGLPEADTAALLNQMRACLDSRGGEVSARARAAALGRAYLALDATGRERFLELLANEFDVDHAAVDRAVDALRGARDDESRQAAETALRAVLVPPRIELATRFNALPEGVKFLVDMRAELMRIAGSNPRLRALEGDLKSLLTTWFDVDFLELRRITWERASAALLEKLIAYEAVHAIRDWGDLKDRLDSDRRCFAFFHPRMPDEPLIFVEVALVHEMADDIQTLLDESAPVEDTARADTAVFYSISNAQRGLDGINLGNFLIKQVVDELTREFEGLTTFATLSPILEFRAWLDNRLANGADKLLRAGEEKAILAVSEGANDAPAALESLIAKPDWLEDKAVVQALRKPLMRLCAHYLIRERRADTWARDPVAHFHLRNGARMERLNWLGDRSPIGLERSAGMMLNYVYDVSEIESNHEAYTTDGRIVAASTIKSLLKP